MIWISITTTNLEEQIYSIPPCLTHSKLDSNLISSNVNASLCILFVHLIQKAIFPNLVFYFTNARLIVDNVAFDLEITGCGFTCLRLWHLFVRPDFSIA